MAQVGYLGRWRSTIIMQYATEALEGMALNSSSTFKQGFNHVEDDNVKESKGSLKQLLHAQPQREDASELKMVVDSLKLEVENFQKGTKAETRKIKEELRTLEKKASDSTKYLPKFVLSQRHQVAHRNEKIHILAPAAHWRTLCGWHYYHSSYNFAEEAGTKDVCSKCEQFAQSRGVDQAN